MREADLVEHGRPSQRLLHAESNHGHAKLRPIKSTGQTISRATPRSLVMGPSEHGANRGRGREVFVARDPARLRSVKKRAPTAPLASPPDPTLVKANEALLRACVDGDLARARAAVGAGAKLVGAGARVPLVEAARRGNTAIVRWLLEKGADVAWAESSGETALFAAAKNGHAAVIEACAEAGDDVNRASSDGATPLMHAVEAGSIAAVRALLSRGANVHATSSSKAAPGASVLHFAGTMSPDAFTTNAPTEIVDALRAAGADPTLRNENGETILHVTAKNKAFPASALDAIVSFAGPVDDPDAWGCSALWHSARANALGHVVLLLAKGADPNLRSTKGSPVAKIGTSVYEIARADGDLKLLAALRDAGALTGREATAAPTGPTDPFANGAQVSHPKFGVGLVTASEDPLKASETDRKITVQFEVGPKILQARYLTAT